MNSKRQRERLIALWILGVVVLNFPFLSLFSEAGLVFKIPVLFLYVFFIWALFIGCVAWICEKPGGGPAADHPSELGKPG